MTVSGICIDQTWSNLDFTVLIKGLNGYFNNTLAINPNYVEAIYNKGVALERLGEHHNAIACYNMILEKHPNHKMCHNSKGNVLAELGKHREAIDCYSKALSIDHKFAAARYNMEASSFYLKNHPET